MAVRPGMQYIIDFARELIFDVDTNGNEEFFTDQQIQDRLDLHRLDAYILPLQEADTLGTDGRILWHDFFAPYPMWEEGATVQRAGGEVRTADEVDYRVGKWHFDEPENQPLYVTGRCYNVHMAASKLAMQMEQELRHQFNFTTDGLTIQRISQVKELHQLSISLAQMGWGGVGPGSHMRFERRDQRG